MDYNVLRYFAHLLHTNPKRHHNVYSKISLKHLQSNTFGCIKAKIDSPNIHTRMVVSRQSASKVTYVSFILFLFLFQIPSAVVL